MEENQQLHFNMRGIFKLLFFTIFSQQVHCQDTLLTFNEYHHLDSVVYSTDPKYFLKDSKEYLSKIGYNEGKLEFVHEYNQEYSIKSLSFYSDTISFRIYMHDDGINVREICIRSQQYPRGKCYGFDKEKTFSFAFNDFKKDNGKQISYYSNGNIAMEEKFVDGKKEGFHKHYFRNGNLSAIQEFHNDSLNGLWIECFEDGSIWTQGKTKANKFDGVKVYYERDGNIEKIEFWDKGVLVSESDQ